MLFAGVGVLLLLVASCQQCLVCETTSRCFECATSSGFEGIYCEVDSVQYLELQTTCNTFLQPVTETQTIEECSDSKAQLNLLESNYESYNLECRRQ